MRRRWTSFDAATTNKELAALPREDRVALYDAMENYRDGEAEFHLKDYLDERIEADCASDPEFAAQWQKLQAQKTLGRLRKDRHLTQAAVAEKMGLPQSRVAEIERHPGRVSFSRIVLYARAVGVSTEDVAAAILLGN